MKQEYVIKKFIRARSAKEAISLDRSTPVSEVFLATDRPMDSSVSAIGFHVELPIED